MVMKLAMKALARLEYSLTKFEEQAGFIAFETSTLATQRATCTLYFEEVKTNRFRVSGGGTGQSGRDLLFFAGLGSKDAQYKISRVIDMMADLAD